MKLEKRKKMSEVQTFEIGINGMACNGCSTNVKGILQKLPGVKEATVKLQKSSKVVTLSYKHSKAPSSVSFEREKREKTT